MPFNLLPLHAVLRSIPTPRRRGSSSASSARLGCRGFQHGGARPSSPSFVSLAFLRSTGAIKAKPAGAVVLACMPLLSNRQLPFFPSPQQRQGVRRSIVPPHRPFLFLRLRPPCFFSLFFLCFFSFYLFFFSVLSLMVFGPGWCWTSAAGDGPGGRSGGTFWW